MLLSKQCSQKNKRMNYMAIGIDCFCNRPLEEGEKLYSFSWNEETIDQNIATVLHSEGMLLACPDCHEKHQLVDEIEDSLKNYIEAQFKPTSDTRVISAIDSKFECGACGSRIPDQTPYFMPTHSIEVWSSSSVTPLEAEY